MASATLNSGMLEALVSRGTTPQAAGPSDPQACSPTSTGEDPTTPHHATYLHAHFQGVEAHYGGSGDLHDVSTSGGDATTEDDEASLNDQLTHFYSKSLGDDNNMLASAKKRRKQSKPIRLPTPQGESGEPQQQPTNKTEEAHFDSEMSNPSAEGEETRTCPHCHLEAPSDDTLRRHIIEEHIGRLLNEEETAHHHQQRERQQEQEAEDQRREEVETKPLNLSSPRWEGPPTSRSNEQDGHSPPTSIPMPPSFSDIKLNIPGLLPLGPPPFLFPFLHQQTERERMSAGPPHQPNSSPSSSNGQSRIFNQEAYCDLCHKEFCNKYFLKTHKANKHGIYSPEVSSSPTGIPSGHSTPLGPSVPLASPLGPSLNPGGLVGSPYAGAFFAASMNTLPLRPMMPTQIVANKPVTSKDTGSSTSKAGVINLEAYCELCQKEFCNKYFLKRHKSKIHGVCIDVVTKPKNPGQMPPRVAPDRPEGWCDACRKDIGGRAALNAHKLQAHGPHIVAPHPSPRSNSPQPGRNPRTPTPKESRRDGPEHREHKDYFSPWEPFKEIREPGKELWDAGRDIGELPRDLRESSRDTSIRSPWDRPLGSPWEAIREIPKTEGSRDSPKGSIRELNEEHEIQRNNSWSIEEHTRRSQYNNLLPERSVPSLQERLAEVHDFPLDPRDIQAMRDQQHRDWELHRRELEKQHREREQQRERERQFCERERHHHERQREREIQQREQEQRERLYQQERDRHHLWEQEQSRERMFRNQVDQEQFDHEQERILMEREHSFEHQEELRRMNDLEIKQEPLQFQENDLCNSDQLQSKKDHSEVEKDSHDNYVKQIQSLKEQKEREGSEYENHVEDTQTNLDDKEDRPEGRENGSEQYDVRSDDKLAAKADDNENKTKTLEKTSEHQEGGPENQEGGSEGKEVNRDSNREGHRTPGGSSADESSRDTGIIARVGQPAMVQAPPGTKFTPEQLRQLGVINPDAFCELCCKEFCNKYFLRTHRIKKHGIYTPEFSDRSKSQHKETSPLSLARLLERQTLELRPTLPDIENELECDLCHRPFPSPYLLQMHKYYFHGPGQENCKQEQFPLHPQPSPHEQLRQLALHAQQQARQQQQHQKRLQEQQRRMQEHQQRMQEQEEKHREQMRSERDRLSASEHVAEDGEGERMEELPRPSVIESAGSGESDASEDLRKLQSMILQLNRQGEMGLRCRLCNKDVGNKYFLRAHMMTEHGILGNEDVSAPPSEGAQTPKTPRELTPKGISPPSTPGENQAFCNICKKDFFSRYILQQHMLSSHGVFTPPAPPTSFMERIRAEVESREDRKPQSTSRSYCEICNKELCNKYFMKTHMMKMHGINLENGVSGGVTCDLCNKELCSKYFLRVHKQNTHGLVEEGREGDEGPDQSEMENCPLCSRKFRNRKWLKTHLTSDHEEAGKEKWREIEATMVTRDPPQQRGQPCGLCGQILPDLVALQLHVIKTHGNHNIIEHSPHTSDEIKQKSLQCSLCPYTAPTPALLYAHARSHAPSMPNFQSGLGQTVTCPLCSQSLPTLEAYQHHLLQHQLQGLLKPLLDNEQAHAGSNTHESFVKSEKDKVLTESRPTKRRKRWRCSQCSQRFKSRALCLAHVHATHNPRSKGTWLGRPVVPRQLFKCRKCGAVGRRLTALRQHIREQHQAGPSVPTSHATPTKPRTAGRFVMQPFLLNKDGSEKTCEEGEEKQLQPGGEFVPSLVYLPVARRVQRPLTVSFSLTPA